MRIFASAAAAALVIMIPDIAGAVNFYDGARAPDGLYFLTYSSVYTADKLLKAEELLRFCYYSRDLVVTALLPAGGVCIRSTDKDSRGLGDATAGAGYFLPVKEVDVLPMLFVKLPTGEYASDKSTNYGTHQVDIRPVVFFSKTINDFSMDAAVKYFFRLENDKDIAPGDELHLQYLLGYNVAKNLKLGPSVNWMMSREQSRGGTKVDGSGRRTLSVGGDIYTRIRGMSFSFTYLYDAYARNSPKGQYFQLKSCYKF
ncbi:MAG: transporter [Candidatus Omnitrophota bacterium]